LGAHTAIPGTGLTIFPHYPKTNIVATTALLTNTLAAVFEWRTNLRRLTIHGPFTGPFTTVSGVNKDLAILTSDGLRQLWVVVTAGTEETNEVKNTDKI